MKKLLLFLFSLSLCAEIIIPQTTQQLLLVSSADFNTTRGVLQAYERKGTAWTKVFEEIPVNLGRSGLAWGKGLRSFSASKNEPHKKEGDGKSPAGLFTLQTFFGYNKAHFNFPYLHLSSSTLCIDDSESAHYNQIVQSPTPSQYKSFEYMRRKDDLYKFGIVVGHNQEGIKKGGSCIFIHIQRGPDASTSGCTSMHEEKLIQVMQWLDKEQSPLLLQMPKSHLIQGFK